MSPVADSLTLRLGSRPVHTVFDLLGQMENDLTYSLGWALAQCPTYLAAMSKKLATGPTGSVVSIDLQEAVAGGGFTDIEIKYERAHIIVEAKRGWTLPTIAQLTKYRPRISDALRGTLVALSEASRDWAQPPRLPTEIEGVPVKYLPWAEVIEIALRTANTTRSNTERRLLRELARYLGGAVRDQDAWTTWTYCVSVSNKTPDGWPLSFREVVQAGRYFHPYGTGFQKTAPNFLAFRWANAVQSIHHVESYRVVSCLQDDFPGIPRNDDTVRPHMMYTLGPKIGPASPLPCGTTYRAARLWVALDLLLSASTLKDALAETKERQRAGAS